MTAPLYIVLSSEDHEKIQLAAMISAVAGVSCRPTNVFVSMGALLRFQKGLSQEQRYQGGALSQTMLEKNAPDAMDLFRQARQLGDVKMYACSMVLDVQEWELDDLEEDLFDEALGLTKFLADAEDAELVVI